MAAHAPVLESEFACVGFKTTRRSPGVGDGDKEFGVVKPEDLLKEKAANEYLAYATGRHNVAFLDIKLSLAKRYNPMSRFAEAGLGFFMESMTAPRERIEATAYMFDGRENDLIPSLSRTTDGSSEKKENFKSSYDGFVFAIVHKEAMRALRDSRYDLSLTSTKDHAKLPAWASVMSESAEITEAMLTSDMVKVVEQAGESLEALIITDQPLDQPKKYVYRFLTYDPREIIALILTLQTQRRDASQASHPHDAVPLIHLVERVRLITTAVPRLRSPSRRARQLRALPPRGDAPRENNA